MGALRWFAVVLAAGCGRIDFMDLPPGDGGAPGGDTTDGANPQGWSHLVAYGDQTCAIRDGHAYCWGENGKGQLGDGTTNDAPRPVEVMLPAGHIDDLSMGEDRGCAIVDGTLYCFGAFGTPAPRTFAIPSSSPATEVAVGRNFACVLAGAAYCWGDDGTSGQLGTGTSAQHASPTLVAYTGAPLIAIEAGDDHACALDSSAGAHCWGHNDNGTLGNGNAGVQMSLSPVDVGAAVRGLPQIAGWHACAATNGAALCWGEGANGQLGDNGNTDRASPQIVPTLTSGVTLVRTGGGATDHDASCALENATLVCWGNGQHGRLGQGAPNNAGVPTLVLGLPSPAHDMALGYDHGCALLADGDVWCWGTGTSGQLGNGQKANSLQPVRVLDP